MSNPKSDRIHDLLPRLLGSRQDENWSALIDAIGSEDDRLAKLIADVRSQFFVKTANRPYLDRLAANNNISRPKFTGMSDSDFRNYVPVLAYQPKQVKRVVETLLDLFFFKEATTAFLSSGLYEPFNLKSGWGLTLKIDNIYTENIKFVAADFSDIANVSADELVAAYNRQANYSYATNFFDSVTKRNFIRIFTRTVGTHGSCEILGGLANIALQLNGFMTNLGTGANTQWNISKIGDAVTFTYSGGALPGIDKLQAGDIYLCDLPGNEGSFVITEVDLQAGNFKFKNLFASTGVITQTSANQAKFLRPEKITAYRNIRRALAWETQAGKVTVEMPATPSIVQRGIKGGFHINGTTGIVTAINSADSLTVADASAFPASGQFIIEPVNNIVTRLTGGNSGETVNYTSNGRLISDFVRYSYSGISGNTLIGISPALPTIAKLNELTVNTLSRVGGTVTCTVPNDFLVGERVIIRGSSGITILSTSGTTTAGSPSLTNIGDITGVAPGQLIIGTGIPPGTKVTSVSGPSSLIMSQAATVTNIAQLVFSENTNGAFEIVSASSGSFTFKQLGVDGTATTGGTASVERIQLANQDSRLIITTARPATETKMIGPYVWDVQAPFVLSSYTTTATNAIVAGRTIKLLDVNTDTMPDEAGYVIFDYGKARQEGPVRYLYKPAANILALDPSYVFQQNHDAGCSVVALSHKGPHILSGFGNEHAPYITSPSDARLVLQELIQSVASAGIFVDFLVRYPAQLYGTISVYG